MSADRQMRPPLEAALAPFKELARINRHSATGADGLELRLVLRADRCHVRLAAADAPADTATIELGFSLGADVYAVHFVGASYRRGGAWDFDRVTTDISTGLRSGGLQPGEPFALVAASSGATGLN